MVTRLIALGDKGLARAEGVANGQWSVEPVLAGLDVRCVAVDPLDPARIYAGTQGQGVYVSADGGHTWRPNGLAGIIIKSLAVSPHQPGTLYAGTKNPPLIYRTTDGGAHWEELRGFRRVRGRWWWRSPAEPPFTAYVLGLAVSPVDPNVVLAGVELGQCCAPPMAAKPGAIIAPVRAATATSSASIRARAIGPTRPTAAGRH